MNGKNTNELTATIERSDPWSLMWDVRTSDPTIEDVRIFRDRSGRWYTVRHEADGSHERVRRRAIASFLRPYGVTDEEVVAAGL